MAQMTNYSRRNVLRWGGTAAGVVVAGAILPNFGMGAALAADLGAGDIGILNYAYALEQLEAAFYTRVTTSPFKRVTKTESDAFGEIRDHEVAHREFFKKALGSNAIADIEVDFSMVDFGSRKSVLDTADAFENLGVAAYNGAGHLLQKVDYLIAAASIVSVEARHAAVIATLRHGPSAVSAGQGHIGKTGLDLEMLPTAVLAKAKPFIRSTLASASLS